MSTHLLLTQHRTNEVITALLSRDNIDLELIENGHTLLQIAAREGLWEVIIILLGKGARLDNAGELMKSPLLLAQENQHDLAAQVLLAFGAKTDCPAPQIKTAIFRALIFHIVRHRYSSTLMNLLLPQLNMKRSLHDDTLYNEEIIDFSRLALTNEKHEVAQSLLTLAKKLPKFFHEQDAVLSVYDEENIEEKCLIAYGNKDYDVIDELLKASADNAKKFLMHALRKANYDLALMIMIGSGIGAYMTAIHCANDKTLLENCMTLIGADSQMHQQISRFVYIDALMTKHEKKLLVFLRERVAFHGDMILRAIHRLHPYPEIEALLAIDDLSIQERLQQIEVPELIYALISERFARFDITLFPKYGSLNSKEHKLANVIWVHTFQYLKNAEQHNVGQVSRHFHRLFLDANKLPETKLHLLKDRLQLVNDFIESAEYDIAHAGSFQHIKANKCMVNLSLFFISILSVSSWALHETTLNILNIKKELSAIKLDTKASCESYVNSSTNRCVDWAPANCTIKCDALETQDSRHMASGFGVAIFAIFSLLAICTLAAKLSANNRLRFNQFSSKTKKAYRLLKSIYKNKFDDLNTDDAVTHLDTARELKTILQLKIDTLTKEWQALQQQKSTEASTSNRHHSYFFNQNGIDSLDEDERKEVNLNHNRN